MSLTSLTVRPWLRTAAVCCLLFTGTVLLFSRGLSYDFSNYDDPSYVTNNSHVQAGFTRESITWAFTGRSDYWHPLTWLSHMLDWRIYRDNAAGHHLTSVLWHALNAVLAFAVLRRLTGAYWTAAFAAALFAWHPLRVESVVWITERKDVMSGCFFLLTLWAYAVHVRQRDELNRDPEAPRARGWAWYAATLALFVGGLMCKPMLVTLPAALLLLDVWPLRRIELTAFTRSWWRRAGGLLLEKAPFFVIAVFASIVTLLMQRDTGAFVLELPFSARLANAIVSVARYLGKFFWPVDLTVCYPHPGTWPLSVVLAAAALVLGLTALAWWQRRTRPWLLVGWIGFLVLLLPASGLVQVGFQAMADRYTYVPVFALQLALLWTLRPFVPSHLSGRFGLAAAAVLVLLGCAVRTWQQQATWRDPATLFRHALAVTERNDVAHALLGYTLMGLGQVDEAAAHCRRALALNPRNETALLTLAGVHEQQANPAAAITVYQTILELNPADAETQYRLGLLLLRSGRGPEARAQLDSAMRAHPELLQKHVDQGLTETLHGRPKLGLAQFELALALNPEEPAAHFGAGLALAQLGRVAEATEAHRNAVRLRPDHAEAHTELGLLLLERKLPAEAERHFRAAVQSQPEFGLAHLGLGRAADQLGRPDDAMASFQLAARHAPGNPTVHRTLAQSFARRQQFADAVRHYERAIELQPADAGLHAELGYALILGGRRAEGFRAWEAALALDPNLPGLRERLERMAVP